MHSETPPPKNAPKIWPGSPRGRCKTSTRDSPKAVAQETPKSWPRPHKDFVSRRKAFCRTLPRLPTRSARLPQRLRKAVARVCPQDVVKTPPAPCRTSTITPRASRPRMPHECQKNELRASPSPTATNEAASNKHTGRPAYGSIAQDSRRRQFPQRLPKAVEGAPRVRSSLVPRI